MRTHEAILRHTKKIGFSKGKGQYKLFFTDANGEVGINNNNDRFAINSVNDDLESIVNEEETTEVSSIYVCSIEMSAPGAYKQVSAKLDNVPISLVIDLGAKVSIISHSFYFAHLSDRVLKPAQFSLKAYDGKPIECLGCVTVCTEVAGKMPFQFKGTVS